jgi:2-amino-4-hydroxy-6-hydroxymethyldihydropteridine diphosphokinase
MNTVYIGLGSNLSDPIEQVKQAIIELAKIPNSAILATSSIYLSRPMGPQDQDDYINAVLALETQLKPLDLLDALQTIEHNAGRVRKDNRWGARILDLDILLYSDNVINNDRLTVPHYGIKEREFVLVPLAEIAPYHILPCKSVVATLAEKINTNGLIKLT